MEQIQSTQNSEQSRANEDKLREAESKLESRRIGWNTKVQDVVSMIRDTTKLAECQVLMLSYRHMVVEEIAVFSIMLSKKKAMYDNGYKIRHRFYVIEHDAKLNGGEKDKMVKSDLALLQREIDVLDLHLDYFKETLKTLDGLGFAIKNRIVIHQEQI